MNTNLDIKPFNDIPYNPINSFNIPSYEIIKEKKCAFSTIGNVCSYNYKTIYKNELPEIEMPYSLDIPQKYKNINDNLDLRNESLKLSSFNINKLEEKYNYNNEKDFLAVFDNINDPMKPIDYDYVKDTHILRGNKVHKKSCNIKPADFSDGKWISQHNNDVKQSIGNKLFDINTKRKIN